MSKVGWLILKRKPGEGITIGDGIEIFVKEVKGKVVSIAIRAGGQDIKRITMPPEAPRSSGVERRETDE